MVTKRAAHFGLYVNTFFENITKMFSGIWRKAKKKNMKKERKFGLKEFPRPLKTGNGGVNILLC
jgi:hypothetical protein